MRCPEADRILPESHMPPRRFRSGIQTAPSAFLPSLPLQSHAPQNGRWREVPLPSGSPRRHPATWCRPPPGFPLPSPRASPAPWCPLRLSDWGTRRSIPSRLRQRSPCRTVGCACADTVCRNFHPYDNNPSRPAPHPQAASPRRKGLHPAEDHSSRCFWSSCADTCRSRSWVQVRAPGRSAPPVPDGQP